MTVDAADQSLAYSTDHGQTWQQYSGNPVLESNSGDPLRDPKVFWYEPGGYWVLVAAAADSHAVQLYKSKNLTDWTLPERGLRRRIAGRPLAEPGPVPAGAGRRPGERQVGDAGQYRRRRDVRDGRIGHQRVSRHRRRRRG